MYDELKNGSVFTLPKSFATDKGFRITSGELHLGSRTLYIWLEDKPKPVGMLTVSASRPDLDETVGMRYITQFNRPIEIPMTYHPFVENDNMLGLVEISFDVTFFDDKDFLRKYGILLEASGGGFEMQSVTDIATEFFEASLDWTKDGNQKLMMALAPTLEAGNLLEQTRFTFSIFPLA